MICSKACMFCESPKEFFINYSKFHGVCFNHSQTYERFYKCTHCSSIVPILPQACTKCLNPNVFTVTSSEIPICLACSPPPPPAPLQCAQCFKYEEVYQAPRCIHLVCYPCFNHNSQRCPICEEKIEGIEIENEGNSAISGNSEEFGLNQEPIILKLEENPEKQDPNDKISENKEIIEGIELQINEIIVSSGKSEEIEINEKPISLKLEENAGEQEQNIKISEKPEVIDRISGKTSIKERKNSDPELNNKKSSWVNAEANNTSIEITEINPLIKEKDSDKTQEKDCTFWTKFSLLLIFYLCTLCFCFSCFCNCFQGFKSKKKTRRNLFWLCLCQPKSLTSKLWTSIVKWRSFSENKDS